MAQAARKLGITGRMIGHKIKNTELERRMIKEVKTLWGD